MKNPLRIGPGTSEQAVGVALLLRQRWRGLVLLAVGLLALHVGLNEGLYRAFQSGFFGTAPSRLVMVAFGLASLVTRPDLLMAFILTAMIAQHPVMAAPRNELKLTRTNGRDLVAGIWSLVFLSVFAVGMVLVAFYFVRHASLQSGYYSLFVDWSMERDWKPFGASEPGLHIPRWAVHLASITLTKAMFMAGVVCIVMRAFLLRGVGVATVLASVGLIVLYLLLFEHVVYPMHLIGVHFGTPRGGFTDGLQLLLMIVGFLLKAGIAALTCWLALRRLPEKLLEAED